MRGIEDKYAEFRRFIRYLLQSIPYDGTSTWGKGADKGFEAFLKPQKIWRFMILKLILKFTKKEFILLTEINEKVNPLKLYTKQYRSRQEVLQTEKFLTFFGGEHSVSIGIIEAFRKVSRILTVLATGCSCRFREGVSGIKIQSCLCHASGQ